MHDNLCLYHNEAVERVRNISFGLEAFSFAATAQGMLQSGEALSPNVLAKIEANRRAMQ